MYIQSLKWWSAKDPQKKNEFFLISVVPYRSNIWQIPFTKLIPWYIHIFILPQIKQNKFQAFIFYAVPINICLIISLFCLIIHPGYKIYIKYNTNKNVVFSMLNIWHRFDKYYILYYIYINTIYYIVMQGCTINSTARPSWIYYVQSSIFNFLFDQMSSNIFWFNKTIVTPARKL